MFIRGGRWYARMCVCVCLYIARGMVQTAELFSDETKVVTPVTQLNYLICLSLSPFRIHQCQLQEGELIEIVFVHV